MGLVRCCSLLNHSLQFAGAAHTLVLPHPLLATGNWVPAEDGSKARMRGIRVDSIPSQAVALPPHTCTGTETVNKCFEEEQLSIQRLLKKTKKRRKGVITVFPAQP